MSSLQAAAMRSHAPARRRRPVAEAVARQRRAHDVEGVGCVASVRRRVGERAEHAQELDDRAGPAVRQHRAAARRRAASGRAGSGCRSPSSSVRNWGTAFSRPPWRASRSRPPSGRRAPQVGQRHALRPVVDRLPLRPARPPQPLAQVAQVVVGDGEQNGVTASAATPRRLPDRRRRHACARRASVATAAAARGPAWPSQSGIGGGAGRRGAASSAAIAARQRPRVDARRGGWCRARR